MVRIFVILGLLSTGLYLFVNDRSNPTHKLEFSLPVDAEMAAASLAQIESNKIIIATYKTLSLVTFEDSSASVTKLTPNGWDGYWNPTGVFYDKNQRYLYVANYKGKNVLVFKVDGTSVRFFQEVKHGEMLGPENVCVNSKGTLAVADYDAGKLFIFTPGHPHNPIIASYPQAHGVACTDEFVYITSLYTRELSRVRIADGQRLISTGSKGIGPGQFLWPTDVSLVGDKILVTDAHQGRISVFDKDLQFIQSYGKNGYNTKFFNFPYATRPIGAGLIVADTLRSRLAFLSEEFEVIGQIYSVSDPMNLDKREPIEFYDESGYRFANLPCIDPYSLILGMSTPRRKCVSGFNSIDLPEEKTNYQRVRIDDPGLSKLFLSHFWYQTWSALDRSKKFIVLGSPQHKYLLAVDLRNMGVNLYYSNLQILPLGNNFYFANGQAIDLDISHLSDQSSSFFRKVDLNKSMTVDPNSSSFPTYLETHLKRSKPEVLTSLKKINTEGNTDANRDALLKILDKYPEITIWELIYIKRALLLAKSVHQ